LNATEGSWWTKSAFFLQYAFLRFTGVNNNWELGGLCLIAACSSFRPQWRTGKPQFVTCVAELPGFRQLLVTFSCKGLLALPIAPGDRGGGGAPAMVSRLSTPTTCGFGVQTSLEAQQPAKLPSFSRYSLENL